MSWPGGKGGLANWIECKLLDALEEREKVPETSSMTRFQKENLALGFIAAAALAGLALTWWLG